MACWTIIFGRQPDDKVVKTRFLAALKLIADRIGIAVSQRQSGSDPTSPWKNLRQAGLQRTLLEGTLAFTLTFRRDLNFELLPAIVQYSRELVWLSFWTLRYFHRQNKRNPLRCQRMSVSGLTTTRASRQSNRRLRTAISHLVELVARRGFV